MWCKFEIVEAGPEQARCDLIARSLLLHSLVSPTFGQ